MVSDCSAPSCQHSRIQSVEAGKTDYMSQEISHHRGICLFYFQGSGNDIDN